MLRKSAVVQHVRTADASGGATHREGQVQKDPAYVAAILRQVASVSLCLRGA